MGTLTRRDFLKLTSQAFLASSGLLGLGALLRFFEYQTEPAKPTLFDLGHASNFPVGSRTVLPAVPAVLIHTEAEFSAISLVCTHLGCTLQPTPNGFFCPCHGSVYDASGASLQGPAVRPLEALPVEITADDHLVLHIG